MTRVALFIAIAALAAAQTPGVRELREKSLAFEVISIKAVSRDELPRGVEEDNPCSGGIGRVTGRRFEASALTLYALIAVAYNPWKHAPRACELANSSNLISGGPGWVKSERYAVQALFPEAADIASYERLLTTGEGADAQFRLQSALRDRFGLVLKQESRDVEVYLLTADESNAAVRAKFAKSASSGGMLSEALRNPGSIFTSYPTSPDGTRYVSISFSQQPVLRLAQRLAASAQRPVLNRSGLEGVFDFTLEYDNAGASRPTLFTAVREQLGLRMRPSHEAIEVLVIENAERPSGN